LECKFTSIHLSDITIADFWRHNKFPGLNNPNGISLILCNTEKGKAALDAIEKNYNSETVDLKSAMYNYKKTITSAEQKEKHNMFLQKAINSDFISAYKLFFQDTVHNKIKKYLTRIIYRRKGH